ncbi:MAG: hypothetical protein HFJ45_02610 [Clostridia bacterium]|nr:hypothetical protein [Clostridia bacterium]
MYLPKKDIYQILKSVNTNVSQTQPTAFNKLPYINFSITDNSVNLDLNNNINYQDIEVQIDIWAEDSVSSSNLLSKVEEKMRENLYILTYSSDVPNTGNIFHIVSRFQTKI